TRWLLAIQKPRAPARAYLHALLGSVPLAFDRERDEARDIALSDHFCEAVRAKAPTRGSEVERLYDARLALPVVTGDHVQPQRGLELEPFDVAETRNPEPLDAEGTASHGIQIRIGMTTAR